MIDELEQAHDHCRANEHALNESKECGCFCCGEIFLPEQITDWLLKWGRDQLGEGGRTALCPFCSVDAVIGDISGVPLTDEFLDRMSKRWFLVNPERGTE